MFGLLMLLTSSAAASDSEKQLRFFEQKVRPLLVKRCYQCHSQQGEGIEAGLALDSRDGWRRGGDSGPAIVPGDVQESLLLQAVRYEDLEMPPDGKLAESEIAVLEAWVKMGAPDPRDGSAPARRASAIDLHQGRSFWAFQPPRHYPAPAVRDAQWSWSDIDRFVLARLEQANLQPSPDADARTWLRRVAYDLTGLPPTRDQIDRFLADPSPAARARIVDRLLGSPHFGEHWGRHWLDVARYADSNGSDFNATFYNAWRYRNYVIRSFNDDKPFDQFVREQLAGDLLPHDSPHQRSEQLVATGLLMIGPKMLSERDKEKLTMDVVDEQIDTVGRALLGLTLGCARCHDHKFDPVGAYDYYALAGIFQSSITLQGESQQYVSDWKETPLPLSPEQARRRGQFQKQLAQLKREIARAKERQQAAKEQLTRLTPSDNAIVVDDTQAQKTGVWKASKHLPHFVGEGYVHDDKQDKGRKSVVFAFEAPSTGQYEVRIAYAGGSGRDRAVPVLIRHADGETRLTIDQRQLPPIEKLYRPIGKYRFEQGATGEVVVSNEGTTEFVIADAVQLIAVEPPEAAPPCDEQLERLANARAEAAESEKTLKDLQEQQAALEKTAPAEPAAMAIAERRDAIQDGCIRIRGDHQNCGPEVPRGFLRVLNHQPQIVVDRQASGRLELAQWIADAENPLTARVIVNRVWKHLIGEGLVRSVDNFGALGERPTHPQLLDHLAVQFVAERWSIKRLVRRICLSRTYAMSSVRREDSMASDAENRLLWRMHRKRLTAEQLRDSLLAAAGKLDLTAGRSAVANLGKLAINNGANQADSGRAGHSMRSVYLPIVRNDLPEFLAVFDFADPDVVSGRRPATNVPAQSLLLLNSPFVRHCAEQTTARLDHRLNDTSRVERLYEMLLGRLPSSRERDRALRYVSASDGRANGETWSRLTQALFASTEFRMLD